MTPAALYDGVYAVDGTTLGGMTPPLHLTKGDQHENRCFFWTSIEGGKKTLVLARYVRNKRLADALFQQAFSALIASPGARAFYDSLRARDIGHNDALRRLSNRLVAILHGCLRHGTTYNEATAWPHRQNLPQSSVAA